MWTVYDHPIDFPEDVVARRWELVDGRPQPSQEVIVTPNLDALRYYFTQIGLTKLDREPEDDPTIVETWL